MKFRQFVAPFLLGVMASATFSVFAADLNAQLQREMNRKFSNPLKVGDRFIQMQTDVADAKGDLPTIKSDIEAIKAALVALASKLDSDAGVTDADYNTLMAAFAPEGGGE